MSGQYHHNYNHHDPHRRDEDDGRGGGGNDQEQCGRGYGKRGRRDATEEERRRHDRDDERQLWHPSSRVGRDGGGGGGGRWSESGVGKRGQDGGFNRRSGHASGPSGGAATRERGVMHSSGGDNTTGREGGKRGNGARDRLGDRLPLKGVEAAPPKKLYKEEGHDEDNMMMGEEKDRERGREGSHGGGIVGVGVGVGVGAPQSSPRHLTDLMDMVEGMSQSQRSNLFSSLSWFDKLLVNGLPPDEGAKNPLPDLEDLPREVLFNEETDDITEKKRKAACRAVELTKAKFESGRGCYSDDDYDDGDDDDDNYDDDDDGTPYGRRPRKTVVDCEHFLKKLPYCLVFDLAFRIPWPRRSDRDLCWCPCGGYMKPWQDFFGLTGTDEMSRAANACGKDGKKRKEPFALLAHLRKQGEFDPLHYGAAVYLESFYGDFNGPELAHKAVYQNVDRGKYEEAVGAENRRNERHFTELITNLMIAEEREMVLRKKEEEYKRNLEEFDKINHDCKLKIEADKEMLRKLGLNKEEKDEPSTAQDIESYRLILKSQFDLLKAKAKERNNQAIKFHIDDNFKLQELLEDLDSRRSGISFLLRPLSHHGSNDKHFHAPKFVRDWKISVGDGEIIKKGCSTKYFFDQVWQQMQALKVRHEKIPGGAVDLFDITAVGVIPTTNECLTLAGKSSVGADVASQVVRTAKRYYRAVGRIMFHALVRDDVISRIAMPAFYQNVIFRECNLQDDRYKSKKVVQDLQAVGCTIDEFQAYSIGTKMSDHFDVEDETVITEENFIRLVLCRFYIDERSIAIDAMREGVTLDGYSNLTRILRIMPEKAVSKLLFAPAKICAKHLFSVMQPEYSTAREDIIDMQKRFFNRTLKSAMEKASNEDVNFLPNFLLFVTGSSFIPHKFANPDYRITVEFDMNDRGERARPRSKACDNWLYLPYHAYSCNGDLFIQLLKGSIDHMKALAFSET